MALPAKEDDHKSEGEDDSTDGTEGSPSEEGLLG